MNGKTQRDRELLEKAARAIYMQMGPEVGQWLAFPAGVDGYVRRNADGTSTVWNPLKDDGDTLRLANRCGISIEFGYCSDDAPVVRCGPIEDRDNWPQVPNFPDPNAATRRAVVEAVAAQQDQLEQAMSALEGDARG